MLVIRHGWLSDYLDSGSSALSSAVTMAKMLNAGTLSIARVPPGTPPLLLVIVDTEEEFDWGAPLSRDGTSVTSIADLPRAHEIFDSYGIVPTYVVDYPVATTKSAYAVLRPLLETGRCEIGAHLHPWVNPPHEETVTPRNSYPGNLPPALERRKLEVLTAAIERTLSRRPVVYKAGRYGVGSATGKILEDLGYEIDASVVPHTNFGDDGGPNFVGYPDQPFWFGEKRRLLEIPLTRVFCGVAARAGPWLYPRVSGRLGRMCHLPGISARLGLLERIPLTPEGVDHAAHRRLMRSLLRRGHKVFSLTYHSPSLGVGHTPYVRAQQDLESLLATMDRFFRFFLEDCRGQFTTPTALHRLLSATAKSAQRGAKRPT